MERASESNGKALPIRLGGISSDHLMDGPPNIDVGIVWERLSIGYRIVDLGKNRFDEALALAKVFQQSPLCEFSCTNSHCQAQFFTTEPMCRATVLAKDKISIQTYLELITEWMNEMRSMCAIHEGTGSLVGIAVTTVNTKANQSKTNSRIRMSRGEAIFKIQTLKSCAYGIGKIYERYDINEYFRLHVLCVDKDFESRGIGTALVRSCVDSCRHLGLPACIGAFSSGASQTIANRLGFETLADIPYTEYVTPERTERHFTDVGPGNYSIACMGFRMTVPTASSKSMSATTATDPGSKKEKKIPKDIKM